MSGKAQYVLKQVNNLSLKDRYTVAKILWLRECKSNQSNNGAYIHLKDIDEETLNDIYDFIKRKLSS